MSKAKGSISELALNETHQGDAAELLKLIPEGSVACSVWSPPYFVGKEYERHLTFETWRQLLATVVGLHARVLKPGGFLVVNIADILCFPDESLPRIQAPNVSKLRSPVTREDVLKAKQEHPDLNRHELAKLLGCSEQTIDRRLNGNNIRGGKYSTQTRVQLVGHFLTDAAYEAGMPLYDRRVWAKDPAWANSHWHSSSYRAVDEFEYLYFFWKPGETVIDRNRLSKTEWAEWGSRAVWSFPSVRSNAEHEAQFPLELPRRVIQLLTDPGETVLDCFMGSGTTAEAAIALDRAFLGIELDPDYCELANKAAGRAKRAKAEALF